MTVSESNPNSSCFRLSVGNDWNIVRGAGRGSDAQAAKNVQYGSLSASGGVDHAEESSDS